MEYGVWCEVWGGVTGSRQSWMKEDGVIQRFADKDEAQKVADDLNRSFGQNPHRVANFRYSVRELS